MRTLLVEVCRRVRTAQRHLAELAPAEAPAATTCARSPVELFACHCLHPEVVAVARDLFRGGHYARAVEEALKALDQLVRERSGLTAETGVPLMQKAFSPNAPLLRLNRLRTQSEKNEQQGYMELYAGAMMGIRNPRAHDHRWMDSAEVALGHLSLASHLYARACRATRTRKRK